VKSVQTINRAGRSMKYFDYLRIYKNEVAERFENSINQFKVQPVGSGYIVCIVMKDNLKQFFNHEYKNVIGNPSNIPKNHRRNILFLKQDFI
jgi:hypothetical protein